MLLEQVPLFLTNVVWMLREVRQRVNVWVSTFWHLGFTTLWSWEFKDAHEGDGRTTFAMRFQPAIEWTRRCTWRPLCCEVRHSFGRCDWVNSDMHLEAVIKRVYRHTWRSWSWELGGCGRVTVEMCLKPTIIRDWWNTVELLIWRLLIRRNAWRDLGLTSLVNL